MLRSSQRHQQLERLVRAPAIYFKIAIEREDLTRSQLAGQVDQAGVREIDSQIRVFLKEALHARGSARELKRNLKNARRHVRDNRLGSSPQIPKQVTSFGDYRLAGDQR